jgi:general secretion pathway protein D
LGGALILALIVFGTSLALVAHAQPEDVRLTMTYTSAPVQMVLNAFREQTGKELRYEGDPAKRVTVRLMEAPIPMTLDAIATPLGMVWWRTPDGNYAMGDTIAQTRAKEKGEIAPPPIPFDEELAKPAAARTPVEDKSRAAETLQPAAAEPPPPIQEPLVTATFRDGKIEQVLMALSQQTDIQITPEGKAVGLRVTLIAKDVPLTKALDMICQPRSLVWWKKKDGSYGIADKPYYEQNVLPDSAIQRIFRPDHIKAEDFEKAIKGTLTPKIGRVAIDPRTNKVIVTDLPAVIELITRLLQEIDVQLVTRVFQVHYADVQDIAKQIEDYKSGPGTIKVDPKTHQIIVTDLLQNIKRMEMLIDVLDVGPEIVVYDVTNIGLDGKALKDLKSIIDSIHTKDLLFEINDKQGMFILEDVPQVHDKVEKILQAFDQPIKQVSIQAEVLTTTFSNEYKFQFDWMYSGDLISAAKDGLLAPRKGTGTSNDFGFQNLRGEFPIMTGETGLGRGIFFQNLSRDAQLTLQMAMTDKTTNVLLQPRLLVKNQESARIFVGTEEPFLTTFHNTQSTGYYGQSTFTQSVVPAGLTFEITPSVSNNGLIELEVSINDDFAQRIPVNAGGSVGQIELIKRDRKQAETVLLIPSGETRMLGGLLRNEKSESTSGIPWLVKIPIIGPLFGSYSRVDGKTNLMLFITPSIVEERGNIVTTKYGRRGRPLTLTEAEEPTSPTATLETQGDYEADTTQTLDNENGTSLLSDRRPDSELPYLLDHDEMTAMQRQTDNRSTSYSGVVGSPSGMLSSPSSGPSPAETQQQVEPDDQPTPEEEEKEKERSQPPSRPQGPSPPETNYNR